MEEKVEFLLKREQDLNIKELKILVEVTSNKDLFVFLGKYLEQRLQKFDFLEPVPLHKHLYKIFRYMMYLIENMSASNEEVYREVLCHLNKNVSILLERIPKNRKKEIRENEIFLKKIKKNIEVCKIQVSYYVKEDHPDLYDFMKYLIFKVKDYDWVYESIKNQPGIVSIQREEDFTLFEIVLLKGISVLKQDKVEDVIYFERILLLFLQNCAFSVAFNPHIEKRFHAFDALRTEQNLSHFLFFDFIFKQWKIHSFEMSQTILNKLYYIPFSKETLEESKVCSVPEELYQDFTDKRVVTVDLDGTAIYEDAFSLEKRADGYEFILYTVDAVNHMGVESSLFKDGFKRAEEFCAAGKRISLFPLPFVKKELSLKAHRNSYTYAYIFQLDKFLNVKDFSICKAKIRVFKNYYYGEIETNLFLDTSKDIDLLRQLYCLSEYLNKRDLSKQKYHEVKEIVRTLEWESRFLFGSPTHEPFYSTQRYSSKGQQIVTELKTFVNSYMASLCKKQDLALIYRTSEFKVDTEKISFLLQNGEPTSRSLLTPILKKDIIHSFYTTIPKRHGGLDRVYCHALTPLRNMPSYLNQLLLDKQCAKGERISLEEREKLEKASTYFNMRIAMNEEYGKQLLLAKNRSFL